MINYHFFSTSEEISDKLVRVISCFKYVEEKIDSETHKHKSDSVLAILRPKLLQIGFQVEQKSRRSDKNSSLVYARWASGKIFFCRCTS